MPLIPLHISAAAKLLCLCSVYQIQYNVSIYINLILRPNLPTKSRSGGLLFFDYFRFIQILNSPDLNFTIRAKARVSHSKIFLPWFSLSNFFCRQSDAADTHILYHMFGTLLSQKREMFVKKFLNRCVKLLRFHIVLNFHCCSFIAFFKPNSGIAIPAAV